MSQAVASSGGRREQEEVGEETGLPLIQCPKCGRARVFESRSQKQHVNLGRVFFKCPRGIGWVEDRCKYYAWQRDYLEDLVKGKVIQLIDRVREHGIEEEIESIGFGYQEAREGENEVAGKMEKQEAKLDKLEKLVYVLCVVFVGIITMFICHVLK